METYMFILLILSLVMTLAPAGAWAGQIAVLISLADLVMLHQQLIFGILVPSSAPEIAPRPNGLNVSGLKWVHELASDLTLF